MRTWRRLLLGALVLSTAAWADTEVEQSCDAAPDGHVRVKNVAGSVQVQTWDRNQVHVKGVLGEDVERLDFAGSGNRVTIEVVVRKLNGRKIDSDLTVSVPKGSSLEVETVSADARVTEVAGKIDAETVSGDLTVERAQGQVHAESISGDVTVSADAPSATVKTTSGDASVTGSIGAVRAESVSGKVTVSGTLERLDVETISGDIDVKGAVAEVKAESVSGDVSVDKALQQAEASTVSGDIKASAERLRAAEFSTQSGRVDFTGDLTETGTLKVSTKSGEVTVRVPENVAARFDVSTLSGRIQNEFGPAPQRVDPHGPGWKLQFGPQNVSASVTIESLSGGIRIGRK